MEWILNTSIIVLSLGLIGIIFMIWRNKKVCAFRISLLKEESSYVQKRIDGGKKFDSHRRFEALPSYDTMLFKFWIPLKKHYKPLSDFYKD